MNRLLGTVLLCGAFALAGQALCGQAQSSQDQSSQTQSSSGSDNIDNLFNGGATGTTGAGSTGTTGTQQQGQQTPAGQQPPAAGQAQAPASSSGAVRPDDILNDHKLHFFGSLDLYGNVGGGLQETPDFSLIGNSFGYDVGGSFTAALGFEIRPATELRIRGKLTYSFPGFEPSALPELSEMFFDYSVLDAVFFRIGIFDYTWGNSQFFQFGNLPARSLPGLGRTEHAALVGADQPAHYHPHAELPGVAQDEHSHGLQHADPSRQVRPAQLRESSHGDIAQPQGRPATE